MSTLNNINGEIQFARLLDEAEIRELQILYQENEAAMSRLLPSWYKPPCNSEAFLSESSSQPNTYEGFSLSLNQICISDL